MSENVIELSESDFDKHIKNGRWIVDFWAPWCGPCKVMAPHFESVAKEMKGKISFAKVNVDENYDVANRFQIMSIPTSMLFEDGEVVHASVGAMNKEQIKEMIDNIYRE